MKRIFSSKNKRRDKDITKVLSQLGALSSAVEQDEREKATQEDLRAQLKVVGQDLKAIKEKVLPPLTKALRSSHKNGNKVAEQVDVLTAKLNNAVRESDPKALTFLEQTFNNKNTLDTPELKRTMAAWGVDPPAYNTMVPTAPPASLYPSLDAMNLSVQGPIAKTVYAIKKGGQLTSRHLSSYPLQREDDDEGSENEEIESITENPATSSMPQASQPLSSRLRSRPRGLTQDQLFTVDDHLNTESIKADRRRNARNRVDLLTSQLNDQNDVIGALISDTDRTDITVREEALEKANRTKNSLERDLQKALKRSQTLDRDLTSLAIDVPTSGSVDRRESSIRFPDHTSTPFLLSQHPKTSLRPPRVLSASQHPRIVPPLPLSHQEHETPRQSTHSSLSTSHHISTSDPVKAHIGSEHSLQVHDTLPPLEKYKSYLSLVTEYSENITITDWVVSNLNRIAHGDGTTPQDQLLVNEMVAKLRKNGGSIAQEAADALTSMFYSLNTTWEEVLQSLAAAYPAGLSSLSKNIFQRIRTYDPQKHRPLTYFLPIFRAAKIDIEKPISETNNGDIYLSHLRRKLPPSQALLFVNAGSSMTWNNLFRKLQEIYNAYAIDDSLSMATSGFGDRNVTRKSHTRPFTVAVNTRSGGHNGRGKYVPFPSRSSNAPRRNLISNSRPNASRANPSFSRQRTPVANTSAPVSQPLAHIQTPRPLNAPSSSTSQTPPDSASTERADAFKNRCNLQMETDLGLNEDSDLQRAMNNFQCWFCGRPSHKQTECFIKALYDITNMRIAKDETGQFRIMPRDTPVRSDILQRQKQKWESFLNGQNALGRSFATINDLNTLLTEYNQPSVLQGYKAVSGIVRPNTNASARLRDFRQGRYQFQPRGPVQTNACYSSFPSQPHEWTDQSIRSSMNHTLNF